MDETTAPEDDEWPEVFELRMEMITCRFNDGDGMISVEKKEVNVPAEKTLEDRSKAEPIDDLVATPRIINMVRAFYPRLVANDILGVQPMTGPVGQIFKIEPQFSERLAFVEFNSRLEELKKEIETNKHGMTVKQVNVGVDTKQNGKEDLHNTDR